MVGIRGMGRVGVENFCIADNLLTRRALFGIVGCRRSPYLTRAEVCRHSKAFLVRGYNLVFSLGSVNPRPEVEKRVRGCCL